MEWLRKDAALKWELDQIASTGPNWREHLEAAENVAAQGGAEAGMGGGGGGGGGGSSAIPEFGGGGGGAVGTPEAGAEAGGEVPAGQGLEPQPAGQADEEETEQPPA